MESYGKPLQGVDIHQSRRYFFAIKHESNGFPLFFLLFCYAYLTEQR